MKPTVEFWAMLAMGAFFFLVFAGVALLMWASK